MGKFASIFDPPKPPKAAVRKGPAPEEPPIVLCKHCGEMLWKVFAHNGSEVALERYQIETEPLLDGRIVRLETPARSPACNRHVRAQGGYRLHEPQWFAGSNWDNEPPGWLWCVSRMSLEDAEVTGTVIYSDHAITCEALSEVSIIGKATASGLEGDDAGDREGKRGYKLPEEMLAEPVGWLRMQAKYLKPREVAARPNAIKPTPRPRRITPDCLTLFAELGATLEASAPQPATDPTPQEAAQTPADSV
jgi:hypothetical protein